MNSDFSNFPKDAPFEGGHQPKKENGECRKSRTFVASVAICAVASITTGFGQSVDSLSAAESGGYMDTWAEGCCVALGTARGFGDTVAQLKKIEKNTYNTMVDVNNMRGVLDARQKIILSLNQMALLHEAGIALIQVSPTDQLIVEVGEMVDNRVESQNRLKYGTKKGYSTSSKINRIDIGKMPSLSSVSGILSPFKSLKNQVTGLYNRAKSMWGTLSSIASGNIWGILDLPEAVGSATTRLSGLYSTISGLMYTGKRLIGKNWLSIEGLMSASGSLLELNREFPSVLGGASPDATRAILNGKSLYYQGRSSYNRINGVMSSASQYLSDSNAALREAEYSMGDALILRPASQWDAAYDTLVQRMGGAAAIAFYATSTREHGVVYSPDIGTFYDGERITPYHLDESFSDGGWIAYEAYNETFPEKAVHNPYSGLARTVAPIVGQLVANSSTGVRLTPSDEEINEAAGLPSIDLSDKRFCLSALPALSSTQVQIALNNRDVRRASQFIRCSSSADTPKVLYTTLTGPLKANYGSGINFNDRELTDGCRKMNMAQATLSYHTEILHAYYDMQKGLTGIAESQEPGNAVESIWTMVHANQNTIMDLQNSISDYSQLIGSHLTSRYKTLLIRKDMVETAVKELTYDTPELVSAAIYGKQGILRTELQTPCSNTHDTEVGVESDVMP